MRIRSVPIYHGCRKPEGDLSLVREDWDGPTPGVPVVPPGAAPGSHVGNGETLNASKREANSKTRFPMRLLEDDQVDRPGV